MITSNVELGAHLDWEMVGGTIVAHEVVIHVPRNWSLFWWRTFGVAAAGDRAIMESRASKWWMTRAV